MTVKSIYTTEAANKLKLEAILSYLLLWAAHSLENILNWCGKHQLAATHKFENDKQ